MHGMLQKKTSADHALLEMLNKKTSFRPCTTGNVIKKTCVDHALLEILLKKTFVDRTLLEM